MIEVQETHQKSLTTFARILACILACTQCTVFLAHSVSLQVGRKIDVAALDTLDYFVDSVLD